jgi:MFS family permease
MSKRWWIAAMLATATAINYLDRQNLPVAISEIQKAIPISDTQYSQLQFLFLLAYGAMYAVGGRLLDLLGARTPEEATRQLAIQIGADEPKDAARPAEIAVSNVAETAPPASCTAALPMLRRSWDREPRRFAADE